MQYKNASCTSLVVALASERVARTRAEQRAAECQHTAREHTLLAAAAEQKSSSLETAMQQQADVYENKIACLATEIEQVSSTLFQDSMQSKTEKHVLAAVRPVLTHRACCCFIVRLCSPVPC